MSIHCSIHLGFLLSLLDVSLEIEVGEHNEEHRPMEENDVAVVFREITLYEQGEGRVHEESGELYQLH